MNGGCKRGREWVRGGCERMSRPMVLPMALEPDSDGVCIKEGNEGGC